MSKIANGFAFALLGGAMALTSCKTTGGGLVGSPLSASKSTGSIYISALQGGIVSRTGAELNDGQRKRALAAEYQALEVSPGGQTVTWRDDDVSGEVVAAAPYQVGNQNCRQYRHKVTVDGKAVEARGTACRNEDGTWTPLT
ncbi:hypothetical protein [Allorhizobium taibaishanense]|uniref:Surface antigen n=1 Tax=Allorhizobium taibaishanense TaxID=887144 RepID=A0A1Q8ZZH9_9HYPH|nr:hypothetical protein [Allorhizobium taibaishanense]MBB4007323.1 surface antigen [Allorhizobium taibaishanense]OLP47697.1 hypothetical protein BJF91_04740 [Allorhizobium taibaishanense]